MGRRFLLVGTGYVQTHFICFHGRHGQFLLLHGEILREFGNRFAGLHQLVETFTNTRTGPCRLRHSLTPGTYSLMSTHRAGTVCDIHQTHPGSLRTEIHLSLEGDRPLFLHAQLFSWVLGIRTRVLLLVQQTLYPRSHLPSPQFCLVPVLLFPTRWLFLASRQHSGTVTHTGTVSPGLKEPSAGARQRKALRSQTDLVFCQAKGHLLT